MEIGDESMLGPLGKTSIDGILLNSKRLTNDLCLFRSANAKRNVASGPDCCRL